jgi:hypothetical protein
MASAMHELTGNGYRGRSLVKSVLWLSCQPQVIPSFGVTKNEITAKNWGKQKGTLLKLLNTLDDREAKGDDKIFK